MKAAKSSLAVGDTVLILEAPDWLLKDLLPNEQAGILACVGEEMVIAEIDEWGQAWVGFGNTQDIGDDSVYSGQSLVVDLSYVKLVTRAEGIQRAG